MTPLTVFPMLPCSLTVLEQRLMKDSCLILYSGGHLGDNSWLGCYHTPANHHRAVKAKHFPGSGNEGWTSLLGMAQTCLEVKCRLKVEGDKALLFF